MIAMKKNIFLLLVLLIANKSYGNGDWKDLASNGLKDAVNYSNITLAWAQSNWPVIGFMSITASYFYMIRQFTNKLNVMQSQAIKSAKKIDELKDQVLSCSNQIIALQGQITTESATNKAFRRDVAECLTSIHADASKSKELIKTVSDEMIGLRSLISAEKYPQLQSYQMGNHDSAKNTATKKDQISLDQKNSTSNSTSTTNPIPNNFPRAVPLSSFPRVFTPHGPRGSTSLLSILERLK